MGTLKRSDTYQTVSISCNKCDLKLFNYKKKNGTKSSLIKIYKDRIVKDFHEILPIHRTTTSINEIQSIPLKCPQCGTIWGRHGSIAGNIIFKCVGGKLRLS